MVDESAENELAGDLHGQTARLHWHELERFFAAGKLLMVADGVDLVAVAATLARDDAERVAEWLANGQLQRVADGQARRWQEQQAVLWAVVVAPWVLVQGGQVSS